MKIPLVVYVCVCVFQGTFFPNTLMRILKSQLLKARIMPSLPLVSSPSGFLSAALKTTHKKEPPVQSCYSKLMMCDTRDQFLWAHFCFMGVSFCLAIFN